MAKVELKKPVVEEISAQIADAESVILVNYSRPYCRAGYKTDVRS